VIPTPWTLPSITVAYTRDNDKATFQGTEYASLHLILCLKPTRLLLASPQSTFFAQSPLNPTRSIRWHFSVTPGRGWSRWSVSACCCNGHNKGGNEPFYAKKQLGALTGSYVEISVLIDCMLSLPLSPHTHRPIHRLVSSLHIRERRNMSYHYQSLDDKWCILCTYACLEFMQKVSLPAPAMKGLREVA